MTPFEPGDVLLVPFPFTDQSKTKQRPAVVLSSQQYNSAHPDIILAPITSKIGTGSYEVVLTQWSTAGLLKASAVKPLLMSFEASLARRKLGSLEATDLRRTKALFADILEL